MNDVTRQTEDLFVNGEFSQIIFIAIVWLRREGWHQEAVRATLFNIYFAVNIRECHTPEMLVLLSF